MGDLVGTLIIFGAGLIVGWNVLPQPKWVQRIYTWVANQIRKWRNR